MLFAAQVLLTLLFLLGFSCEAKVNPNFKQLGERIDRSKRIKGPQRNFGSAIVKRFQGRDEVSFKVGAKDEIHLVLASDDDGLECSVAEPGSKQFKPTDQLKKEGSRGAKHKEYVNGKEVSAEGIDIKKSLRSSSGGNFRVKVASKVRRRGKIRTTADNTTLAILNPASNLNACLEPTSLVNYVSDKVVLRVGLCDVGSGEPQPGAMTGGTLSFQTQSENDRGSVEIPASGDDGWAIVSFTPTQAEIYSVVVDIEVSVDGDSFERQASTLLLAVDQQIRGVDKAYMTPDEDGAMSLKIAVQVFDGYNPSDDGIFIVQAQIVDSEGRDVVDAGGLSTINEDNELELLIQPDWFEASDSGFTIEYLRISNEQGTVPLLILEDVHVEFSGVFGTRNRRLSESAEERHRRMSQGIPPTKIMPLGNISSTNGDFRRRDLQSNGRVIFTHGYCSGDVWEHYLGSGVEGTKNDKAWAKFTDFNQNRDYVTFAKSLGEFGDQYTSCSIIAHSQGGAAALHLHTYHWSCLDNAPSGSRLIQSVGTPYQGTALAGNLASVGNVFGVGCGYNYDLTYAGAKEWLAGIPNWARSNVYYRTTSFTSRWWSFDFCHFISGGFLDDPDDGTTEKWAGELPGGNNLGHKTGWCHTSGMSHPAQTQDKSETDKMLSNASV